jgi:hypothetical protein
LPPVLALAQSAGVVSVETQQATDFIGMGSVVDVITFKKPEVWDKKLGLCYGHRVVDKIVNWSAPVENVTEVKYHWKLEPANWLTTANMAAAQEIRGGDDSETLRLMNNGWEVQ